MTICKPSGLGKREEREFVDREECIDLFKNALINVQQDEHSVLVYYGITGSGKTSLIRKLLEITEEYNYCNHPKIGFALIDLTTKTYLNKSNFLFTLRNELYRNYGVKFRFFDYAYEAYWNKSYPTTPLKKENSSILYEIGLDAVSKIFKDSRYIDFLIPSLAIFAIEKATESFKKWYLEREKEMRDLSKMTPTEIEEQLHLYWAWDLITYLHKTSNTVAIFIDAYENLEIQHGSVVLHSEDEWIRDLIEELPNTFWIIGGKNKLQWGEVNPRFRNCLKQKKIEEFTEEYSINFLNSCKIEDTIIQKRIIESSRGLPFYLNLSVDTYWNIINTEGKQPSEDDFAKVPEEVFKRFIGSVKPSEQNTIITLSIPNFWNYDLFEALFNKFNLNCEASDFPRICHYSFVHQKTEYCWCMHNLMRESLQEYQNQEQKKRIHSFLFDYYNKKLKGIESCKITEEQKEALQEAFYHSKFTLESRSLLNWFIDKAIFFYNASLWKIILPLYEEILQIIINDFGNEDLDVPHILNNQGVILIQMGRKEEAKQKLKKALNIRLKLSRQKPTDYGRLLDLGTTLNNFGYLLSILCEREEAKQQLEKALCIREDFVGRYPDNIELKLDLERTLFNLADLLFEMGEEEESKQKYEEALKIGEKVLERYKNLLSEDSTNNEYLIGIETTLSYIGKVSTNLGNLLVKLGNIKEAKRRCQRAIDVYENLLNINETNIGYQLNLSQSVENYGDLLLSIGKREKARQKFESALKIREKILNDEQMSVCNEFENILSNLEEASRLLNNLATLLSKMGRTEEANRRYEETLKKYENACENYINLLKADPTNEKYQLYVGTTIFYLSVTLSDMGRREEAMRRMEEMLQMTKEGIQIKYAQPSPHPIVFDYP